MTVFLLVASAWAGLIIVALAVWFALSERNHRRDMQRTDRVRVPIPDGTYGSYTFTGCYVERERDP